MEQSLNQAKQLEGNTGRVVTHKSGHPRPATLVPTAGLAPGASLPQSMRLEEGGRAQGGVRCTWADRCAAHPLAGCARAETQRAKRKGRGSPFRARKRLEDGRVHRAPAPALSLPVSKTSGGDSAHRLALTTSVTWRCEVSAPTSSGLPDPRWAALVGSPGTCHLALPPGAHTDQALQSSFTTEPVGYRVPWNSQGQSAGATQPPSSKISPRVTAKARLTPLRSCSHTFHGSPGPVIRIPTSELLHH